MRINRQLVVFDAADLDVESRFWAGVLGGTVNADDDWHTVLVDGEPRMAVQLAPDHAPPEWPDGNPQQIHLDLWVDDIDSAHTHVMTLGARLLKEAEGVTLDADVAARTFHVEATPAPSSPLDLPV
jgi:catechol 2,3-dioxygenase-like lactoylglutathione lyase family enzyme